MEAVKEITGGLFPPHVYLLDGNNLVAYIKKDTTAPFYFKSPIKGFDKRGRKFEKLTKNPFKIDILTELIVISGSKGNTYYVDPDAKTCTCQGFAFRGACKHILELA
jgi:hypothetical protein